jgi:LacI family transcriptional regulator
VNEITPESRSGLLDRYVALVIATPLAQLCRDLVAQAAGAVVRGAPAVPGQHFLRPELYLPESI